MLSTLSAPPMALFVVILSVIAGTCRGGLKNQRNYAHVYGKRASEESYGDTQNSQDIQKFPLFPEKFPADYAASDEGFFLRRGDPNVKTKANVAHMFGRELYDNYPDNGDLDMYNEPELEEEVVEVPTNRAGVMIRIPVLNSDINHRAVKQRERLTLQDLLSASRAVRMEALAYLNNISNSKRGNV